MPALQVVGVRVVFRGFATCDNVLMRRRPIDSLMQMRCDAMRCDVVASCHRRPTPQRRRLRKRLFEACLVSVVLQGATAGLGREESRPRASSAVAVCKTGHNRTGHDGSRRDEILVQRVPAAGSNSFQNHPRRVGFVGQRSERVSSCACANDGSC